MTTAHSLIGTAVTVGTATGLTIAMTVSSADIPVIILAVATLVAAVGTVIVNIMVARMSTKADTIKASVDGSATAAAAREESMRKELAMLRERLAEQTTVAAVLARDAAVRDATVASRNNKP